LPRPTSRRCRPTQAQAHATPDLSYGASPSISRNGDKAKNPLGQHAKVRKALELSLDREAHQPGRVQRRVRAGQSVDQPAESYYQKSLPIPKRDVAKAKALIKEAGVTPPIAVDFMVPQGAENKAMPKSCRRWRRRRAST
jgi:peptide/nickel transport system substrate-binding protein